jgi:hypothetical protein
MSRAARQHEPTTAPCGCKSGAAMTLLALVGWPLWIAVSGIPRTPVHVAEAALLYVAVVVGSAAAGKLAGIAVGQYRQRRRGRRTDALARARRPQRVV